MWAASFLLHSKDQCAPDAPAAGRPLRAKSSDTAAIANMTPMRTTRIWRGSLAIPVVVHGTDSSKMVGEKLVDRVIVGALTLTSTKCVAKPTEEEREADPNAGNA